MCFHFLCAELQGIRTNEFNQIASEQRRKTPVTGDLRPLAAALPKLERHVAVKEEEGKIAKKAGQGKRHGKYSKRYSFEIGLNHVLIGIMEEIEKLYV